MVYFLFLPLALVLVMVLVPIRGKSRKHGRKEKKRSHRPTKLIFCFIRPPVYAWSPFVSARSPFPSTGPGSPFVSTHSGSPFASTGTGPQALVDTAGLYELGYRHAPLPLPSLSTGSSGSVPPFGVISIPLARNMLELRLQVLKELQVELEDVEL